jgi:hypothetical protein
MTPCMDNRSWILHRYPFISSLFSFSTSNFTPSSSKFHGNSSIIFYFRIDLYSFNSYWFYMKWFIKLIFFQFHSLFIFFSCVRSGLLFFLLLLMLFEIDFKIEFVLWFHPPMVYFLVRFDPYFLLLFFLFYLAILNWLEIELFSWAHIWDLMDCEFRRLT